MTSDDDVFEAAQSKVQSVLPVFTVQPDAEIIPSSRAKELLAEVEVIKT